MKKTNLIKLELKNFLGSRGAIAALLCLLFAGGYAIHHGKSVLDRQRAIIAQIPAMQAGHIEKQLALSTGDLGGALYYLQFSTVHDPSSWAAFSIGQRDVNPYNVKVRMLTLESQLYDSEIVNPVSLLYGNFDLAFVIVFLFPLAVIAFCHNLISAEQESGVWNLLRSQPVSAAKIVGRRIFLRFGIVLAAALGLVAAGAVIFGGAPDARLVYACLTAAAYLAFWFALAALVIGFQKSSAFNALTLLGVWIFLTILAPALLNLVIATVFPVSESFDVTVRQREGYHQKWDRPKAETMAKFYEKYPEYRSFPVPEDKFSWGWYYAAQNAGDEESADAAARYIEKLKTRDSWTRRAALFLPSVAAQLSFNELAGTDLESHLDYLDSVRDYHRRIREHFYPLIFRTAGIAEVDWNDLPRHAFDDEAEAARPPALVAPLLLFALAGGTLARRRMAADSF